MVANERDLGILIEIKQSWKIRKGVNGLDSRFNRVGVSSINFFSRALKEWCRREGDDFIWLTAAPFVVNLIKFYLN